MPGRLYSAIGDNAVTATPGDTVISLQSVATLRPILYEFALSTTGTAADNMIQWLLRRFDTDDGTGSSITPNPLDTTDSAAAVVVQDDHSTEPSSFTVTMGEYGVHQRHTFIWRGQSGRGIIMPAVATEGLALTPINASYVGLANVTVFFEE